jgi:hypothetical protein
MLERLYASIAGGPSINCRPHNSRQRIDVSLLTRFKDTPPGELLVALFKEDAVARISARVPQPAGFESGRFGRKRTTARTTEPGAAAPPSPAPRELPPMLDEPPRPAPGTPSDTNSADTNASETKARERREYEDQQSLLSKLRVIVDEARTYENDTGVYVLNVGFPIVSLPPGASGVGAAGRRVMAPIAFIPVTVTIRAGATPTVDIECREGEVDRVVPNEALLAWLEQQTGKSQSGELFADDEGREPWKEIHGLVKHVAKVLEIEPPELFRSEAAPSAIDLVAVPRADDAPAKPAILSAAIIGLFPSSNQGLLSDTRAMQSEATLPKGPIESFLRTGVSLDRDPDTLANPTSMPTGAAPARARDFASERYVASVDPCQARAVTLARTSAGLVVHGPPGTGKSQTITNIISDHLAHGQRVLFVCDKRTALDVVFNRLEHVGLGDLCALIHDPQNDQRDLYMSIRTQVEGLVEETPRAKKSPSEKLAKIDAELLQAHTELTQIHRGLMDDGPDGHSLHELIGRWLTLSMPGAEGDTPATPHAATPADDAARKLGSAIPFAELSQSLQPIREATSRASAVGWASNPWAGGVGITLDEFLARPMEQVRASVSALPRLAEHADATRHDSIAPFTPDAPLQAQAQARATLASLIPAALATPDPALRARWAVARPDELALGQQTLQGMAPSMQSLRGAPPDMELVAAIAGRSPTAALLTDQLATLDRYLAATRAWWGFLAFSSKRGASSVLATLGLPLSPQSAERARTFLGLLRAMSVVEQALATLSGRPARATSQIDLASLLREHASHEAIIAMLAPATRAPLAPGLEAQARDALRAGAGSPESRTLIEGLEKSALRSQSLLRLEQAMSQAGLFSQAFLAEQATSARRGHAAFPVAQSLLERLPQLDEVVRVRDLVTREKDSDRRTLLSELLSSGLSEAEAVRAIERASLHAEITRRLAQSPPLRTLDPKRCAMLMSRLRELQDQKLPLVVEAIRERWQKTWRERLVASTGNRLSSLGAQIKQRLMTRGKNAMRLRQVMAMGRGIEGGDPIMDLRPVWMASPETVAQVFPREAVFDTVVFDEASQLRLEDALPVLVRARRVVIAGDPKQLPPTRFFESAVAESEAEEVETEQDLFEVSQREIEDLLTAALSLDIQQSYLDVHYRSKNADLIEFSNQHFYGSRLQAIPAHPRSALAPAAVRLQRVDGLYAERCNEAEADAVVALVRELLNRPSPPTIGVGCFNVAQRDLIVERLDELAEKEPAFAKQLAEARSRRGKGSFEGLFVKNLENIQGDERDHIIISTTYGPDAKGRFYRRFGPLGMPGGGRRLNVLVTRARSQVHLLTSIPRSEYAALSDTPEGGSPEGKQPGGGWLLFAYLRYAELIEALEAQSRLAPASQADQGTKPDPTFTRAPVLGAGEASAVASAFGWIVPRAGEQSNTVINWGNEGFRIDLTHQAPNTPPASTLGVLFDGSRYAQAREDPIGWDVFRCAILEGQGWRLERLWSPELFRDVEGCVQRVRQLASTK